MRGFRAAESDAAPPPPLPPPASAWAWRGSNAASPAAAGCGSGVGVWADKARLGGSEARPDTGPSTACSSTQYASSGVLSTCKAPAAAAAGGEGRCAYRLLQRDSAFRHAAILCYTRPSTTRPGMQSPSGRVGAVLHSSTPARGPHPPRPQTHLQSPPAGAAAVAHPVGRWAGAPHWWAGADEQQSGRGRRLLGNAARPLCHTPGGTC